MAAMLLLQTLAFHEHEETGGQRVGVGDGQGAGGARELVGVGIELRAGFMGQS